MLGVAACTALSGTLGATGGRSGGGKPAPWRPGELKIHVISTGVGECQFFVFPDGTTLLLDCGDHAALTRKELSVPVVPDPSCMAGEWAARYVLRVNPNRDKVDYIEPSHWHHDHTGSALWQTRSGGWGAGIPGCFRSGFALAAEFLRFSKAIDRGYPDYSDPMPVPAGDLTPLGHMKRLYAALGKRDGLTVEKIRVGADDQIVPLKHRVEGFSVFNLCANGRIAMKDGSIRDIYRELFRDGKTPEYLNENGLSIGHIIRYGKFSYFTAGDFSDSRKMDDGSILIAEDVLAEAIGHVNAAKLNHHGHHSMPPSLVKALCPQIWTACVWDQLHTVPETLSQICDESLYPAGAAPTVIPSVFPEPRLTREKSAPYFRFIDPACFGSGCHVVITVPENAEKYRVECISAKDESMTVLSSREVRI